MTAFVTGGSRGIGAQVCKVLSENGWKVAFTYKSSEKQAREVSKVTGALAIKADVSSPDEIRKAVFAAEKELGDISLLVCCAGIAHTGLVQDMTDEQVDKVISTDLTGVISCARAVIPSMIRNKSGVIITVSSMWGEVGASCEAVYSAAKAGVIGFTKALAKELGPSGIRVNCVSPGVIDTDMNSNLSSEDFSALCDETPLGRIGTVQEVASAIEFLASEKASFITGECVKVNGGLVI